MGLLPRFQSADQIFMRLQTRWISIIDPFISNPSNNVIILSNIDLVSGPNVVNHKLGRKLTGWRLVRVRAAATIYDTQDSNPRPELTLLLNASAPVTVDLELF